MGGRGFRLPESGPTLQHCCKCAILSPFPPAVNCKHVCALFPKWGSSRYFICTTHVKNPCDFKRVCARRGVCVLKLSLGALSHSLSARETYFRRHSCSCT